MNAFPDSTPIKPALAVSAPIQQQTQAVRAGLECDDATGCVVPPIHLTSTFAFRGFGQKRGYDYTRSGNPTRDLLAQAISQLEEGAGAVVTATGVTLPCASRSTRRCGGEKHG